MWGWKAESTNLASEGIVCKAVSFLKLGFGTERRENCALGNSHQGERNAHRSNLLCTKKPGVKSGGSKVQAIPGICCVLTWGTGAGILGANEGARHCFLTLYPSKGFVVLICARITPANICVSIVCVMSSGLDQDAWHPGEQASAQITYITDWSVFREGAECYEGEQREFNFTWIPRNSVQAPPASPPGKAWYHPQDRFPAFCCYPNISLGPNDHIFIQWNQEYYTAGKNKPQLHTSTWGHHQRTNTIKRPQEKTYEVVTLFAESPKSGKTNIFSGDISRCGKSAKKSKRIIKQNVRVLDIFGRKN